MPTPMNLIVKDTETTDANVRFGQIRQYAARLVDPEFRKLDSIDLICARQQHIVPMPKALEVTGVHPRALSEGMSYYAFACEIHKRISSWKSAIHTGHNIIRFDEEIERTMYYMNLLDPYQSVSRGSLRLDTVELWRACYACDPNRMPALPKTARGNPSFKLDKIGDILGYVGHKAHDALGDVDATIWLMRWLRDTYPEVWDRMILNTDWRRLKAMLTEPVPFMLVTSFGPVISRMVAVISHNPENPKQIACFDLSHDPDPWLDLSPTEIALCLRARRGEEPEEVDRDAVQIAKMNGNPKIFPITWPSSPAPTAPLDEGLALRRFEKIMGDSRFRNAMGQALAIRADSYAKSTELETLLYGGSFFTNADKDRMTQFHKAPWTERFKISRQFSDPRLHRIARRLLFAEAPETLPVVVRQKTEIGFLAERILGPADSPYATIAGARAALPQCEDWADRDDYVAWLDNLETTSIRRLAELQKEETPQPAPHAAVV